MKISFYFFIALIFSGCFGTYYSPIQGPVPYKNITNNYDSSYSEHSTDFQLLTRKLVNSSFCKYLKNERVIYVTDFVNQKKYQNKSELGFILADTTKVNIQRSFCTDNLVIKTLDISNQIAVDSTGFHVTTRKLKDLKERYVDYDKKIVVGTYTTTTNQLVIFLRLIDLKTNNTLATSTVSTPITYEILQLDGHEFEREQDNRPFHL